MSAMPSSQRAVISVGPGELALKEGLPVPNVEDDMVLVKTKCVALNPADYKMSDFSSSASGAIYGNDFSGIITSVPGSSVRNRLNVGDRVCGMVFGADQKCPNNGAFAEYVAATGDLLVKIPQEMSFEDAATIGVGTTTAGLALYQSLGLPMPDKPASKPFHVLVYGGSTATGTIAIQLVKLSGAIPIATCSPQSLMLVESRGAAAVFDYHSSSCAADIRKYTRDSLGYVLDCIADSKTMKLCYDAMGTAGGKYVAVGPYSTKLQRMRRDIKPDWVMAWTVFGKTIELPGVFRRAPMPEDHEFATGFSRLIERLLEEGKLKTHPVKLETRGLLGIPDGLDMVRHGKVSGQKLVYHVD